MNPRQLRKSEIGAHADYSKKNGPDEFDFMRDMEKCMLNTSKILKKGSYYVLVIGDSILKGRNIQNNEILKQAAKNTPFNFVTEFTRNLKLSKKSFNPKIGNIKTEKIKNDLGIPLPLQTHKQTHRQGRAFRYNLFSQRTNANAEKRIFTSIPNAA